MASLNLLVCLFIVSEQEQQQKCVVLFYFCGGRLVDFVILVGFVCVFRSTLKDCLFCGPLSRKSFVLTLYLIGYPNQKPFFLESC